MYAASRDCMARDLVVTSASGYTLDQVKYWINSLDQCGFDGERLVFVGNHDERFVSQLRDRGCQVVTRSALFDASLDREGQPFDDKNICVDRFFLLWKYLRQRDAGSLRYVVSVDMRDAVFQLHPGEWLATHLGDKRLIVASEGLAFADEPWNRGNMREAFGTAIFNYMSERVVWNCGSLAGEAALVRDLALPLYLCSRAVTYSDQSALNILLSLTPYRDLTRFDDGTGGWACQAATMVRSARGVELSYQFRGHEPLFDGDTVYTSTGRPFCVVHQYDRIPAWKIALEKRFG
jgi:hypothetical protein